MGMSKPERREMPKTATATPKPKKSRALKLPSHEEIALRAYELYLERNGALGNPFEDWTRAERELLEAKPVKSKPRRKSNVTSIAA
jgi:hypothetical protein